MQLVYELFNAVETAYPNDNFIDSMKEILSQSMQARSIYGAYNRAFSYLDQESWRLLKRKAIQHFRDHREGQLKQGFFNQLNDAFAYQYLVRKGCSNVRVLREDGNACPDISYLESGLLRFCEVKSIGISDDEIQRRNGPRKVRDGSFDQRLSEGFLNKLASSLTSARAQITSNGGDGLVFVVVTFDDFTTRNYRVYRAQLANRVLDHDSPEVFIKVEIKGNRRIYKPRAVT
ncbi:MAG: hypothetical protein WCD07_10825 [Burkholderiales bacterium]